MLAVEPDEMDAETIRRDEAISVEAAESAAAAAADSVEAAALRAGPLRRAAFAADVLAFFGGRPGIETNCHGLDL